VVVEGGDGDGAVADVDGAIPSEIELDELLVDEFIGIAE